MADLDDLIARLEAATEGSRELDEAITSCRVGFGPPFGRDVEVLAYTTSIDAALTLVPEGRWWQVGYDTLAPIKRAGNAQIGSADYSGSPSGLGNATTPALALCIAALKAKRRADAAAETEPEGGKGWMKRRLSG